MTQGKHTGLRVGMLDLLTKAGSKGMTTHEIAAALGAEKPTAVTNAANHLRSQGKVQSRRQGRLQCRHWIAGVEPERVPDQWTIRAQPKSRPEYQSVAKKLDPKAPALVPPTVKVTIAPPFVDRRFTFDPPRGWTGEITRDWQRERLERHG